MRRRELGFVVCATILLVWSRVAFGAGGTGCTTNCGGGGGGPPPDPNWQPYGFTMPTDPVYGGGSGGFRPTNGWAQYMLNADPNSQELLGLVAKGNIVIGDYTDPDFQTYVAPRLSPGADSVVQPYVIDDTDAALGYNNYPPDAQGRPRFDGRYTSLDGGQKLDGSSRKFYESSLSDAAFQQQVTDARLSDGYYNAPWAQNYNTDIDAALFTNHAVASLTKTRYFFIKGSVVGRDDAMVFQRSMQIDHDIRLLGDSAKDLALPRVLKRLSLVSWAECPPDPTAACSP